jgi:hypothetical protein
MPRSRARSRNARTRSAGYSTPARVVGRDEHHRARPLRDRPRGLLRIGQEPRPLGERHGAHARHVEPHLVIEIPGRGQENLIPRRGQRRHRRAEGLVAAARDRDLGLRDPPAVTRAPPRRDLRAQLRQAPAPARRDARPDRSAPPPRSPAAALSGGGSTGAAWLTLMSGLSGGKTASATQRRASITGGASVAARLGLSGRAMGFILAQILSGGADRREAGGQTAPRLRSQSRPR